MPRRTVSSKLLSDKAFDFAKNLKYDRYQQGPASSVYKILVKKSSGGAITSAIMLNQLLAGELHKPTIRKLGKWEVCPPFKDKYLGCWSRKYTISM